MKHFSKMHEIFFKMYEIFFSKTEVSQWEKPREWADAERPPPRHTPMVSS